MEGSATLAMLAITALYYGYKELRKPQVYRRAGLGIMFLIFGVGYLIWTFVAPAIGALAVIMLSQMSMILIGVGILSIALGLAKLKAKRKSGLLNVIVGLGIIAYAYFFYG